MTVPEVAKADAAISIDGEALGTAYDLGDANFTLVVTNPGTEPLEQVVVTQREGFEVSGPFFEVGDDDMVLAPGEQWRYSSTGIWVVSSYGFDVKAEVLGLDTTVSASVFVGPDRMLPPIELSATASQQAFVEGETVVWDIRAVNVSPHPWLVGELDARALPDNWEHLPVGDPEERGTDDDGLMQPGESWRWAHNTLAMTDGSYLQISLSVARVEQPNGWLGITADSPPLSVTPGTTTTTPTPAGAATATSTTIRTELPSTGEPAAAVVPAALGLLAAGATLLMVARRASGRNGARLANRR